MDGSLRGRQMERSPEPVSDPLVAVLYSFEGIVDGARRSIALEELSASKVAMLEPQLAAAPKRSMVDYGSGLLVYDEYGDARTAASAIATVASRVELREVLPVAGPTGDWRGESGVWFAAVPGGLHELVAGDARR